jgi:hypothetical protein
MSNGDWGGFTGWDSINIPMPNATWSGTTDSGTYTGGTNQPTVQTGGMPANWVQQLGSAIFGGSGSGTGTSALLGGALAGLLGNNGGAATATTAPWAGAQPYLIDALTRASQLAGQTPAMPAAPTFGAVPDYTTDQYLQGAINAATQPMRDNFAEFQMPEIRSSAIANGQLGGSRQGIAEGIALSRLNRDIGQIGAGMSQALYGTNLNNRTQQYQMSVANQQQDFTNNMARTQAGFAMPWQALTNYGNMAVGASGRGQTSSVTTPNNPLLNIAGGAATGAGLYKSIYGGA